MLLQKQWDSFPAVCRSFLFVFLHCPSVFDKGVYFMTKNIAHRGFSGRYPENTMLAFQQALAADCDGIELDVHLTRDGHVVIIHDESIDRTTNGKGLVRDYTLEELQTFDAYGKFQGEYGFQHIPTLEEYFDLVAQSPIFTNIELKNNIYYYTGLEEKVIALIRRYRLEERVLFSSFNHCSMLLCKRLAPEIPTGFLTDEPIGNAGIYVRKFGADFWHPNFQKLTQEEIAMCQAQGVGINAWTVNKQVDMKRLTALAFHGVITNFPDRMKKVQKMR